MGFAIEITANEPGFLAWGSAEGILSQMGWACILLYVRFLYFFRASSWPALVNTELVVTQALKDILPLVLALSVVAVGMCLGLRVSMLWSYTDRSAWGGESGSVGPAILHMLTAVALGEVSNLGLTDVLAENTTNITATAASVSASSEIATLTSVTVFVLFIAIIGTKLLIAVLADSYNKVMANAEARATFNRAGLCIECQVSPLFVPGGGLTTRSHPWLHVLERTTSAQARAISFQAAGGSMMGLGYEGQAELERKMPTDPTAVPSHLKPTFPAAAAWSGSAQAMQRSVDQAAKGHLLESARLLGDVVPPPFDGNAEGKDRQMYDRLMRVLKEQENIIRHAYDETRQ